jgi:uncharacterized protein involved in response to NO
MIFGFGFATVTGFLLTAVPSWTGRPPLQGVPLAMLVMLWVSGRAAMLLPGLVPPLTCALLDVSLQAAMIVVIAREILIGRNWRNLPILAALALLLIANLLMHAGVAWNFALAMTGSRLGVATLLALITLIGGRIIPNFTRNWMTRRQAAGRLPSAFTGFDGAVLAVTTAALLLWVIWPDAGASRLMLVVAGILNALRLARWRGLATIAEPLLLVLHLGYAWLAAGLLMLGANVPADAALHALTVGAIGTMTLAVMARASLGHTGRALTAGAGCSVMFALISVSALLRIAAAFDGNGTLLDVSGLAWVVSFGLYLLMFAPLLWSPRKDDACAAP